MSEVYGLLNQKGGVGKSATCFNLGVALVREGKRVLIIDADPQRTISQNFGLYTREHIPVDLNDIVAKLINGQQPEPGEGIYKNHKEGIHLLPHRKEIKKLDERFNEAVNSERVLKQYIDSVRNDYDYIIIDSPATINSVTRGVMAAADKIIIPTQPARESVDSMGDLMEAYFATRVSGLNPNLEIKGLLFTMVEGRVRFSQEIMNLVNGGYGEKVNIFMTQIPRAAAVGELCAKGKSVFCWAGGKAAKPALAFKNLAKEVTGSVREIEKQDRTKELQRDRSGG